MLNLVDTSSSKVPLPGTVVFSFCVSNSVSVAGACRHLQNRTQFGSGDFS